MECGGRTVAGECEETELAVIGKRQNRVWFDWRSSNPDVAGGTMIRLDSQRLGFRLDLIPECFDVQLANPGIYVIKVEHGSL